MDARAARHGEPELMPLPFVSVIIPHFNDVPRLTVLLESLEHQTYPAEAYEVIVVDNGSSRPVAHLAERFRIRLLYETENRGSYAARNRGIAQADGDIFAFTDSDCRAEANWLAEGVKTLRDTGADMGGGAVLFEFSKTKRAAEYYDAVTNLGNEKSIQQRGVAKTANLLVKKEVPEALSGFPGQLKSGGDIYFTAMAVKRGFKLVYADGARVHHPTRGTAELMKKAVRVGIGKAMVETLPGTHRNETAPEVLRGTGVWAHLNPLVLRKKLAEAGYPVTFPRFLNILWISYCYLFLIWTAWWVTAVRRRVGAGAWKRLKPWVSLLVTLGLAVFFAHYVAGHWRDFQVLASVRPVPVLLMFPLYFLAAAVSSVRLLMVMRRFGLARMTRPAWLRIFLLGRFLGWVAPQGGNLYRGTVLKRKYRFAVKDYVLGFLTFTWLELAIAFCLITATLWAFQPRLAIAGTPALLLSAGGAVVLVIFPVVSFPLLRRVRGRGWAASFIQETAAIFHRVREIRFLARFSLWGLLSFVVVIVWFHLAFSSLGISVGIGALAIFTAVMRMGLMVNITPGNIGIIEMAYGLLASGFGIDFSVGLMVGAVTRAVSFLAILAAGILLGGRPLLKSIKREAVP